MEKYVLSSCPSLYVYIYVNMHICILMYVYMCIYMCVHIYIYVCV